MASDSPPVSPLKLTPARELKITFLLDDCIEWMTKFPPGFSTEVDWNLRTENKPPHDREAGVSLIDLDSYCCGAHGFSVLIEINPDPIPGHEKHTVLFDTGPDKTSIIRNLRAMHVDVGAVDRVVLSHWHSDHSGGLLEFLKLRNEHMPPLSEIVVDLHPDRPTARGIAPQLDGVVIGRLPADPTFEAITERGARIEKHSEGHVVAGGSMYISGEIHRDTLIERGLLAGMRFENEGWFPEQHIMDERYVVVDVSDVSGRARGLVVFTACSHAGIMNIVRDVVRRIPDRPIFMIIGGLHLASPELQPHITPTVEFLTKLSPPFRYILPMHCSGSVAKVALANALKDRYVPVGAGMTFDSREMQAREKY